MGRAWVIAAGIVAAWTAVARAETTTLPVSRVNVVLPDGWAVTGVMRGTGDRITGPAAEVVVIHADDCDVAWSVLDEHEQSTGDPELGDLPEGWIARIWPGAEAFCHERDDAAIVVRNTQGRDGVDPLLEALGAGWFSNRRGARDQLVVLPGTGLTVELGPHLTLHDSDRAARTDVLEIGPDWEFEPDGTGREEATIHRVDEPCDEVMTYAESMAEDSGWPRYELGDGRYYYCAELPGATVVVDFPDDDTMKATFRPDDGSEGSAHAFIFGVGSLLESLRDERIELVPAEQVTLGVTGYRVTLLQGWRVEADGEYDKLIRPSEIEGLERELLLRVHDSCSEQIEYDESRRGPTAYDDSAWIPPAWKGGPMDAYCTEIGGRALTVRPSGVEPTRRETLHFLESLTRDNAPEGGFVDEVVTSEDLQPSPERPASSRGSVIGGIMPRTAHLALVRRSDDMGEGFGFGLQLGRMGWREGYRFTVGYEVAGAATEGFWELSAQVRPGFSPVTSDLPVDAYVALGVDVVGGKHQPETDVAPVVGAGAEVLFTLPGLGAELGGQALADPSGFHSYTLRGGLLFGNAEARIRVGANYVRFADESTVLWMTLGMTVLELD